MITRINRGMDFAEKAAYFSCCPTYKLGAVLMHVNKVISIGFNKLKTDPRSTNSRKTVHAEYDALGRIEARGLVLYVCRITNGHRAMAMPCEDCYKLCKRQEIKEIFYSDYFGLIQKLNL